MPLTAITTSSCPKGRAGVSKFWATECANVSGLTFDADHQITAITMETSTVFVLYTPEKDTAFLTQEKTKIKNTTNVTQTLSVIFPGQNHTSRKALKELNDECCLNVIAKDRNAKLHYLGITYDEDTDTYENEDMATGDGSANTGTDPNADSNEYVETFTAQTGFYAPFLGIAESAIPVA